MDTLLSHIILALTALLCGPAWYAWRRRHARNLVTKQRKLNTRELRRVGETGYCYKALFEEDSIKDYGRGVQRWLLEKIVAQNREKLRSPLISYRKVADGFWHVEPFGFVQIDEALEAIPREDYIGASSPESIGSTTIWDQKISVAGWSPVALRQKAWMDYPEWEEVRDMSEIATFTEAAGFWCYLNGTTLNVGDHAYKDAVAQGPVCSLEWMKEVMEERGLQKVRTGFVVFNELSQCWHTIGSPNGTYIYDQIIDIIDTGVGMGLNSLANPRLGALRSDVINEVASIKDVKLEAWLGDAKFESAARESIVKQMGRLDVQLCSHSMTSNEVQARFWREECRKLHGVCSLWMSDHLTATWFEACYNVSSEFREWVNYKIGLTELTVEAASRYTTAEHCSDSEEIEGDCWTKLFKDPLAVSSALGTKALSVAALIAASQGFPLNTTARFVATPSEPEAYLKVGSCWHVTEDAKGVSSADLLKRFSVYGDIKFGTRGKYKEGKLACKRCNFWVNPVGECSKGGQHVFNAAAAAEAERQRARLAAEREEYHTKQLEAGFQFDEMLGEYFDPASIAEWNSSNAQDNRDYEAEEREMEQTLKGERLSSLPFANQSFTYVVQQSNWGVRFEPAVDPLAAALSFKKAMVTPRGNKIRFILGACGSGKTIFAPSILAEGRSVVMMIPTIKAAQNAFGYYASLGKRVWMRAGLKTQSTGRFDMMDAEIVVMTTGASLSRMSTWVQVLRKKPLVVIDEAHVEVENVEKILEAIDSNGVGVEIALATATPSTDGIPWFNEKKHAQDWYFVGNPNVALSVKGNERDCKAWRLELDPLLKDGPTLIVGASLDKNVRRYLAAFDDKEYCVGLSREECWVSKGYGERERLGKAKNVDFEALERRVGNSVIYFSTPVVEVGVTLANLKNVISLNEYIVASDDACYHGNPFGRFKKASCGCVKGKDDTFMKILPANWASVVQRAGRVSRTSDGTVIVCGEPEGKRFFRYSPSARGLIEEEIRSLSPMLAQLDCDDGPIHPREEVPIATPSRALVHIPGLGRQTRGHVCKGFQWRVRFLNMKAALERKLDSDDVLVSVAWDEVPIDEEGRVEELEPIGREHGPKDLSPTDITPGFIDDETAEESKPLESTDSLTSIESEEENRGALSRDEDVILNPRRDGTGARVSQAMHKAYCSCDPIYHIFGRMCRSRHSWPGEWIATQMTKSVSAINKTLREMRKGNPLSMRQLKKGEGITNDKCQRSWYDPREKPALASIAATETLGDDWYQPRPRDDSESEVIVTRPVVRELKQAVKDMAQLCKKWATGNKSYFYSVFKSGSLRLDGVKGKGCDMPMAVFWNVALGLLQGETKVLERTMFPKFGSNHRPCGVRSWYEFPVDQELRLYAKAIVYLIERMDDDFLWDAGMIEEDGDDLPEYDPDAILSWFEICEEIFMQLFLENAPLESVIAREDQRRWQSFVGAQFHTRDRKSGRVALTTMVEVNIEKIKSMSGFCYLSFFKRTDRELAKLAVKLGIWPRAEAVIREMPETMLQVDSRKRFTHAVETPVVRLPRNAQRVGGSLKPQGTAVKTFKGTKMEWRAEWSHRLQSLGIPEHVWNKHGIWVQLDCCGQEITEQDLVLAENDEVYIVYNKKSKFNNLNWISKKHSISQPPLPFLQTRGYPLNATLPYHAHGAVICRPLDNKPLGLVSFPNQVLNFNESLYLTLAAKNRRAAHLSSKTQPKDIRCKYCRSWGWPSEDVGVCESCAGLKKFPMSIQRNERALAAYRLIQTQLNKIRTLDNYFLDGTVGFPSLPVVWIPEDMGKTCLWKAYPNTFAVQTHAREAPWDAPFRELEVILTGRVLLASTSRQIPLRSAVSLGATGWIGPQVVSHHGNDWFQQRVALERYGVAIKMFTNPADFVAYALSLAANCVKVPKMQIGYACVKCGSELAVPSVVPIAAFVPPCPCGNGRIEFTRGSSNSADAKNTMVSLVPLRKMREIEVATIEKVWGPFERLTNNKEMPDRTNPVAWDGLIDVSPVWWEENGVGGEGKTFDVGVSMKAAIRTLIISSSILITVIIMRVGFKRSVTFLLFGLALLISFCILVRRILQDFNPFPSKINDSELLSSSEQPEPVGNQVALIPVSQRFLISTYGTRGDHTPMMYYARLAASLGVPTHVWRIHSATHHELEDLKKGKFWGFLPDYVDLAFSRWRGYKYVFQPHVPITTSGESYSLSPSWRWIRSIKYGGNRTLLAQFVSALAYTFLPHWRIGCLPDSDLPRSADGQSLIEKRENTGEFEMGWCCGSASESVIPDWIKENYPRITSEDHQNEFPKYKRIACHGGAGTEDMKGMCGVARLREDVMDKELDRDYIAPSIPQSLHSNKSPLPFVGMLVNAGFTVNLPLRVRLLALVAYWCHHITSSTFTTLVNLLRAYLLITFAINHYGVLILLALSFPYLLMMAGTKPVRSKLWPLLDLLFKWPMLIIFPSMWTMILLAALVGEVIPKTLLEIQNWFKKRTSIVIERTQGMPLPFGHMTLKDNVTGRTFEGSFRRNDGFGEQFGWLQHTALSGRKRKIGPTDPVLATGLAGLGYVGASLSYAVAVATLSPLHFLTGTSLALIATGVLFEPLLTGGEDDQAVTRLEIPVPFMPDALEEAIKKVNAEHPEGFAYSPWFNCHTLVIRQLLDTSFFMTLPLIVIYILSLLVLIPGHWASIIARKTGLVICGVDVNELMARAQIRAAFAATTYGDEEEEEEAIGNDTTDTSDGTEGDTEECYALENDLEEVVEVMAKIALLSESGDDEEAEYNLSRAESRHASLIALHNWVAEAEWPPPAVKARIVELTPNPESPYKKGSSTATAIVSIQRALAHIAEVLGSKTGVGAALRTAKMFADVLSTRLAKLWNYECQLFGALLQLGEILVEVSYALFKILSEAVFMFLETILDPEDAKRLKAVWAFAGIGKTPLVSVRRRIENNTVWAKHGVRPDFIQAFTTLLEELNEKEKLRGLDPTPMVPQFRPVRIGKPVLTREQAELLGFAEHDYIKDEPLETRVGKFRDAGVPPSADTVYKTYDPSYLSSSGSRYSPQYEPITQEDRLLAQQIADEFVSRFPSTFTNMEVSTFGEVAAYYKTAYAAGSPWISIYRRRQEVADSGKLEALFDLALDKLEHGNYPTMFHKAFIKSAVVDIQKVINENKNVRTVVAEELLTYFMNQALELERNKRHDWLNTGVGIGMVMNQTMVQLFNNLNKTRAEGAILAGLDAHEYDSTTRPFTYEVLGRLAERGYENHPNGANLASVLKAKYDSLQHSFIFLETMPNYMSSLSLIIPDGNTREEVLRSTLGKTISAAELNHYAQEVRYGHESKFDLKHEIHELYKSKIIIAANEEELVYRGLGGREHTIYLSPLWAQFERQKVTSWDERKHIESGMTIEQMVARVHALFEHKDVAYNVVHKNRGGGTGENATSFDNTWGFKAAFVAAWCRYHDYKYSPKDFFDQGNQIYNTGDDTATALKAKKNEFDREKFIECMKYYGPEVDFDFFQDIREVEYLGKGVKRPSIRDRKELEGWQKITVRTQLQRAQRAQPPRIPEWIVYQRTRQSWIRQSSNRYYQNTAVGRRWLHANLQKQAGTAPIAVFNRQLWYGLANNYIEDSTRLAEFYGVKDFKAFIDKDQDDLPYIHFQYRKPEEINALSRRYQFHVWLTQSAKFPSYARSLKQALQVDTHDTKKEHEAFLVRIRMKGNSKRARLAIITDDFTDWFYSIPREFYKMSPNLLSTYPDEPWYTENKILEKFVYSCNPEAAATKEGLTTLLQRSPYGSVAAADGFYEELTSSPEFTEEILNPTKAKDINYFNSPARIWGNLVGMITFMYGLTWYFEKKISAVPVLGLMYSLFMFTLFDLPRFYSLANNIYWHAKGDSSPTISAMMPKDPYIWPKKLATTFLDIIYSFLNSTKHGYLLGLMPGAYDIATLLARGTESVSAWLTTNKKLSKLSGNQPYPNVFEPLVETKRGRFQNALDSGLPIVLTAETGLGKSSIFPYALFSRSVTHERLRKTVGSGGRIIISFPRIVLREKWNSDFDSSKYPVQRLKRDVKLDANTKIILGTDGHILRRLEAGAFTEKDVFLLDEFHELGAAKLALAGELIKLKYLTVLLSATPRSLPFEASFVDLGLPARFRRTIHVREDSPLNNYLWAREIYPEQAKSAIIKLTTLRELDEVADALSYLNIKCHKLSRATADDEIPEDALIISTDIISAGVSIPGRHMLISNGKHITNHQNNLTYEPTDANTEHQIASRVGRYSKGDIVVRPKCAGTGRVVEQYPDLGYLAYDIIAKHHKLPKLVVGPIRSGYFRVDGFNYIQVKKSVQPQLCNAWALLACLATLGISKNDLARNYSDCLKGRFAEELVPLKAILRKYPTTVPFHFAYPSFLNPGCVAYTFEGDRELIKAPIADMAGHLYVEAPILKAVGGTITTQTSDFVITEEKAANSLAQAVESYEKKSRENFNNALHATLEKLERHHVKPQILKKIRKTLEEEFYRRQCTVQNDLREGLDHVTGTPLPKHLLITTVAGTFELLHDTKKGAGRHTGCDFCEKTLTHIHTSAELTRSGAVLPPWCKEFPEQFVYRFLSSL
nr:replicase [Agaricus bisporus virus 2]